jgi:hypothetical protein
MLQLSAGYQTNTSSGNLLKLDIFGKGYDREVIPLFYPVKDLIDLCGDCKGFSGGCPGYAPYFTAIKPSCPWFYVLVVRIDVAWGIQFGGKSQYFQFNYCDRLTAAYLMRITRAVSEATNAFRLVCGGCNSCKSRGCCSVLQGLPCAQPRKRTYSCEATGMDCSELHQMMFGTRLPYWYYETETLPRYMWRYAGFFLPGLEGFDQILMEAITGDRSFSTTLPTVPQKRLVRQVAPTRLLYGDAGMEFEAYEYEKEEEKEE